MPGTELIKHARELHSGVPAFIATGNATVIEGVGARIEWSERESFSQNSPDC